MANKKRLNEHEVSILQSDGNYEIEGKLFNIFSKIFVGVEREKFTLYGLEPSAGSDFQFKYNIHCGGKSIEFEKISDHYWEIHCQSFSLKSLKFKTKLWRTGHYIYSNVTGQALAVPYFEHLSENVLEDKRFKISADGTTNYAAVLRLLEIEKKKQETVDQAEKNYFVAEAAIVSFEFYSRLPSEVIKDELEKELNKIIPIDSITIGSCFYSKFYNYEAEVHITFSPEYAYPMSKTEEIIGQVQPKINGMFQFSRYKTEYKSRPFKTSKEAASFVAVIKKREKLEKKLFETARSLSLLDKDIETKDIETEEFDAIKFIQDYKNDDERPID